jgi:hypothetical protein
LLVSSSTAGIDFGPTFQPFAMKSTTRVYCAQRRDAVVTRREREAASSTSGQVR